MGDGGPRFDGIGLLLLGLSAVLLISVALVGGLHTPTAFDDTSVQVSQAWAAWAMVVVSVIGGLIGAISLFLIYRTLQAALRSAIAAEHAVAEARKATSISEQIGKAQVRAYLTIGEVTLSIRGHILRVTAEFANVGQSPARAVTLTVNTHVPNAPWNSVGRVRFRPIRKSGVRIGETGVATFEALFEPPSVGKYFEAVVFVEFEYDDVFRGYEDDRQPYSLIVPNGAEMMKVYRMKPYEEWQD
jgi:hypothetical protein